MKIAIIGLGISGLAAAYTLKQNGHQITAYEKNDYIGGHSRTIEVMIDGKKIPVDTGFIVFNYRNYPQLTRLFGILEVPVEKSDMSFGASIGGDWLEYGTKTLASIFSQKKNLLRPAFIKMLLDILKFNRRAKNYLTRDDNFTLGQCLDEMKMGKWFKNYFILPLGGAIWSTPVRNMPGFPAKTFIKFFDEHGLLTVNDQPLWYTVTGGSREYIKRLTESFKGDIKLNHMVKTVTRKNNKVIVDGEEFDKVIFGCHADQALSMLADGTPLEKEILGNFKYRKNDIIVHSDESFLPRNKGCHASWIYKIEGKEDHNTDISLSYWMNSLQNIKSKTPVIVTLNPPRRPQKVHNEYVFEHPVFDVAAINSQSQLKKIQGVNNVWFCGAYMRYGFHEDGFAAGLTAAEDLLSKI